MTLTDLERLALHHERAAANQFALAYSMQGEVAANFRAAGAQHQLWAEQLRQLIAAFNTIAAFTRP